jgi:hypothetical protein
MSDELLQKETPTETVETPSGDTTQKTGDRTFSQAELDAAIKGRLEREKVSTAKKLTDKETELAQARAELETERTLSGKYKTAMEKWVEVQTKTLPEATKELIQKLDLSDQIDWLEKHGVNLARVPLNPLPAENNLPVDAAEQKRKQLNLGKSI